MAKPIQLDFVVREPEVELQQRLASAQTEHAAAIVDFLELLEVLHRRNVLSTLRGAVGAGDELIGHISEAAAQPESVRGIRNMLAVAKIVGQIDPELIEEMCKSIPPEFMDRSARSRSRAPGIWKTFRLLRSAPFRRVLFAFGLTLAHIGRFMNNEE
jgi:uncharacterized protein YjgD (DUF1641 family)